MTEEGIPQGWTVHGATLARTFRFASYGEATAFAMRAAMLAEARGHHPDITLRPRSVRILLTSHDMGTITARDTEMAAEIGTWRR